MRKRIIKNSKGITIIALIVTIIVMLILLGVALNSAIDGRLFGYTKKAQTDTDAAMQKEQRAARRRTYRRWNKI